MKNVLAVADGGPTLDATISAAVYLATLVDGQLDVLHVRDAASLVSKLAVSAPPKGRDPIVIEDSQSTVAERAARAHQAFDALAKQMPRAEFIDRDGNEATVVVELGRVSDVLVVGRPGVDERKPEPAYVGAAIYESARPIMVVPPSWRPGEFKRALIAWNGSAQAARALGYAIPVLKQVPNVTVLSVGTEDARAPTEPALRYLARHGIDAGSATFDAGTGSARERGRTLLHHVGALGADLMVMGAYGEGGVLSFLGLGGATGKIITASKVPVLMAR